MQITYFPYLHMQRTREATFADLDIKVWNYNLLKDQYVTNPDIKGVLDLIMATNVFHGRPITDMGIISVGAIDFREYTVEEEQRIAEVRALLFVASLFRGSLLDPDPNKGHHIATTENFSLTRQGFDTQGERMSIIDGYIATKHDMGYKIAEIRFERPEYVLTPFDIKGNQDILRLLLRLRKRQKRLYRRLLRAIDMVMQAYYNDGKMSENARIMLLAGAYEILFDLPEQDQRKVLKDKFREYFVFDSDPRCRYKSPRRNGYEMETDSVKVMWVDKFYALRNSIIHGSTVKRSDFVFRGKQRHLDIAILFFALGMKKVIGECKGFEETADEIHWKKYIEPGEPTDDFNYEAFVYEELDPFVSITRKLFRRGTI